MALLTFMFHWLLMFIYRVYTKEWCGLNSEYYWNRTILLCMLCIRLKSEFLYDTASDGSNIRNWKYTKINLAVHSVHAVKLHQAIAQSCLCDDDYSKCQ
jgi:hypothetical protein